jgi:hypothetical protein
MGPNNQGHVRYPLYNASKNETLKNRGKRENLMGRTPPQSTMEKMKKGQKRLLSNCFLHSKMIVQEVEHFIRKCLGEYVWNLLGKWIVLQIDDHLMYHISDVMNMDLNVFGQLSLHWISTKLESTLIVTPNDIQTMELDSKLGEEVLKPKCLNNDIDHPFVLDLC